MRSSEAKITSKGQITIPIEIRKELCIRPGDRVAFRVEDGTVYIERWQSAVERTAGIASAYAIFPPPSAEELRQMAADAIAESALDETSEG